MAINEIKWNEAKKRLNEKKITYLVFSAEWCGDCVMMEPIVDQLADHFNNDINVNCFKIDAEESLLFRDEKSKYKVSKIPTHVFLKNGEIINIKYEYVSLNALIEEIEKLK